MRAASPAATSRQRCGRARREGHRVARSQRFTNAAIRAISHLARYAINQPARAQLIAWMRHDCARELQAAEVVCFGRRGEEGHAACVPYLFFTQASARSA